MDDRMSLLKKLSAYAFAAYDWNLYPAFPHRSLQGKTVQFPRPVSVALSSVPNRQLHC